MVSERQVLFPSKLGAAPVGKRNTESVLSTQSQSTKLLTIKRFRNRNIGSYQQHDRRTEVTIT